MGVYIRRALEQLGVESVGDIGLKPQGLDPSFVPDPQAVQLARVALWLSTPPHVRGWYEGQLGAILTMWESTEIPPGFRQNLHHFDRVFVPSRQNQELYSRFHDDVRYVPLGVDSMKWFPRQRPAIKRDFRFLTAGFGPRKGSAQVAKAFLTVFPDGKPPTPLDPIPRLQIRSRDGITGPGITSINQSLSGAQEIELYANAHCFVSGSKGEGWGLMPLQAIAQGLPTILGNAHGHAAFAQYGIGLDTHPYDAKGATFWGDGGEWWEPDFDQMCEAMWQVYSNYALYEQEAMVNAYHAIAEFPWSRTAEELIFNLPEMFEEPPTQRVWREAPPKLFHIRVNKAVTYNVNGVAYHFNPGVDYYEAADLKRAIIAAGHLEWATFDPNDLGLEDDANVAELRARNSICDQCHMPFNRDDTLRDLIGALDE
jgi:glycosyltransferase involved in cell wall biosynthesis